MAMLAEPRRKTKWTLNPRGKLWSEDSNKFGQKLLEKMGWKVGKGLGANEQGITSHIHVKVKSDNTGVGFKGKDTDWCKHQSQFDEILANLSENMGGVGNHVPSESLEQRSKASKARLHYHKFTRGKDVSKYSSKDLGCILGVPGEKSQSKCNEDLCKVDDIGVKDYSFGVKTIIGGSIDDYLSRKQGSKCHVKAVEREDGQEKDACGKKRKAGGDLEWQGVLEDIEENEEAGAPLHEVKVNKQKRKRKKLKCEEVGGESGEVSNVLAYVDESEYLEGNIPDYVELEKSERKNGRQRKKSQVLHSVCADESPRGSACDEGLDMEGHPQVQKKKRKAKSVIIGEIKENLSHEEADSDNMKCIEYVCKNGNAEEGAGGKDGVGKRKKKKCIKQEDSPQSVDSGIGTSDDFGSIISKKSKKSESASGVEMGNCELNSLRTDNDISVGDRSSSTKSSAEEQVFEGDEVSCEKVVISSEVKRPGKLRKKRRHKVVTELNKKDHRHSCLNRKECDDIIISSSCKMFEGASLVHVDGYGISNEIQLS